MKHDKDHVCRPEAVDSREALRASVGRDGRLRLGKALRAYLPPRIQVGFDSERLVLVIAGGDGQGIAHPRCGVLTVRTLPQQITATGLRLPVSFRLAWDEGNGCFLGRIVPRRRRMDENGRRQYDMDQLLILSRHVLDSAVAQLAKSTPLAERRAIAAEALCEAAQAHRPEHGCLGAYLERHVRRRLLSENRQYATALFARSLDQPLRDRSGNAFSLYDTLCAASAGGIDQMEARILEAQFLATLPPRERALTRMLQEGFSMSRIVAVLELDARSLRALALSIREQWRRFCEG